METIITYLKTQIKRPWTIQLIGAGLAMLVVAAIVGVSDNPPGLIIAFIAMILLGFSLVHHWREPRLFGTLLAVSAISFPVLVLLHNVFDGINQQIGSIIVVNQLLEGFAVISFLAAIFLAPAGIAIGIFAGLFYLIKSKF
jgi:hypothetical protein